MPKAIVICCDGTGNRFGKSNTNVVKLCEVLDRRVAHAVFYDPGVGTIGDQSAPPAQSPPQTRAFNSSGFRNRRCSFHSPPSLTRGVLGA